MNKVHVIGIGYRPLNKKAKDIICSSEVILASKRLFEVFKEYSEFEMVKDKIRVINNVDETINFIKTQTQNSKLKTPLVTLLASGDPMLFGIGRKVVSEFGKDAVEISPDLSSIQMAFSRIKTAWDDAFVMSLHGGPDPEKRRRLKYEIKDIPFLLERHKKLAILTDRENNPAAIAKEILTSSNFKLQTSNFKVYVCEKLEYHDEKITEGTPQEIAENSFTDPNVVIITTEDKKLRSYEDKITSTSQPPNFPTSQFVLPCFGLKEDEILHLRGLITKDEVRAVTIHKLRLPQKGILWDIGAGSGSISIEAARLCPGLKVFAIEKEKEQINIIKKNKTRFYSPDIEIIEGVAPEVLKGIPSPDRVFIGGSGGRLHSIIKAVSEAGCRRIVINAVTFDTLTNAQSFLKKEKMKVEITEVNISKTREIKNKEYLSASTPIFIITGEKANG